MSKDVFASGYSRVLTAYELIEQQQADPETVLAGRFIALLIMQIERNLN